MKQSTPDLETPIFQELNKELGELPEIDIHGFDEHAFDFLREYDEQKSDEGEAEVVSVAAVSDAPEPVAMAAGGNSRRGGRRRKGD